MCSLRINFFPSFPFRIITLQCIYSKIVQTIEYIKYPKEKKKKIHSILKKKRQEETKNKQYESH